MACTHAWLAETPSHSHSSLLFFSYRGGCHDGRARDRDDQDAQGPVALVQQLAAPAHPRARVDRRRRRRGFVGVRLGQACCDARARRVRGPRKGRRGASRFRGSVARG